MCSPAETRKFNSEHIHKTAIVRFDGNSDFRAIEVPVPRGTSRFGLSPKGTVDRAAGQGLLKRSTGAWVVENAQRWTSQKGKCPEVCISGNAGANPKDQLLSTIRKLDRLFKYTGFTANTIGGSADTRDAARTGAPL